MPRLGPDGGLAILSGTRPANLVNREVMLRG